MFLIPTVANPAKFTEIAYLKWDGAIGSWFVYSFDLVHLQETKFMLLLIITLLMVADLDRTRTMFGLIILS